MTTSTGKPVTHASLLTDLLQAIQLPAKLAVIDQSVLTDMQQNASVQENRCGPQKVPHKTLMEFSK